MFSKIKLLYMGLFILMSLYHCNKNTDKECDSIKIQLLLEDIFKKKHLYSAANSFYPHDSSTSYNYLYSTNINIPDKDFYLHWDTILEPTYPDSVKLKILNDNLKEKYANQVSISLVESNEDTTKIKVMVGYSIPQRISVSEATFTYSFDAINCKWTVLDSTFWQY